MRPNTAKTLGKIGSIFSATIIGAPIGYILVLLGLRGLGDYYKDERIKRNALRWFIWSIAGVAAVVAVYYLGATILLNSLSAPSMTIEKFYSSIGNLSFALLVTAEIFAVISAVYLRAAYIALFYRERGGSPGNGPRPFKSVLKTLQEILLGTAERPRRRRGAKRRDDDGLNFKTLADLYILVSALIITGVGFFLIPIFWALSAKAFSSVRIK